jgi:hypothetical protein
MRHQNQLGAAVAAQLAKFNQLLKLCHEQRRPVGENRVVSFRKLRIGNVMTPQSKGVCQIALPVVGLASVRPSVVN